MKKTVSVNIKGTNFLIEEDAYELLQSYMKRLELSLKNEQGSKEIIEDIEYRIAELCGLALTSNKQVVELEDIEKILETLGQPEEFVDETSESFQEEKTQQSTENLNDVKKGKRLFRDVENGKIAGVCSGLASYFSVDVIAIRILFLVVFFFGGFSIPLYIILWIVTPKVNSSIDRLRMQGKPITVDSVKEEVEAAANRFSNETKSFANKLRNNDELTDRISSIGRVISVVVGIGMVVFGGSILVSLIVFGVFDMAFIPAQTDQGFMSLSYLSALVIENDIDVFWMRVCAFTVGFSVVLFLFLLGSKLIFRLTSKWTKYVLSTLFFIGLVGVIVCSVIGVKVGREMTIKGEVQRKVADVYANELIVEPQVVKNTFGEDFVVKNGSFEGFVAIKKGRVKESEINFIYKTSTDTLYHVYQELSARGYTHNNAVYKAKRINHAVVLNGNKMFVHTDYDFPIKDKLRDQEVTIVIEIPQGKTVKFPHHTISLGTTDSDENVEDPFYEEEGELDLDGEYYHWD
jgi:phage shock protein PspC (stress-responsive transcriptional regulator)